jgi:hypothetical protein
LVIIYGGDEFGLFCFYKILANLEMQLGLLPIIKLNCTLMCYQLLGQNYLDIIKKEMVLKYLDVIKLSLYF